MYSSYKYFLIVFYTVGTMGICPLFQEKIGQAHAYLWFGQNDDFIIRSVSKCFMSIRSQILFLKQVYIVDLDFEGCIYFQWQRWENGERFWREKNKWNKGINKCGREDSIIRRLILTRGHYICCFLCLEFSTLISTSTRSHFLTVLNPICLCVVSCFNLSFFWKLLREPTHNSMHLCWLSSYIVSFLG